MMNNGILGEAKVIAYFLEKSYDVFNQFGGKAPFDLVIHRDNILQRVSIKSTSRKSKSGKWEVQIGRIRPNRNGNTIHKFDTNECDVLAIYIIPEDFIVIIDAKTITSGRIITVSGRAAYCGDLENR